MVRIIIILFYLFWSCGSSLADTIKMADKGKELYRSYGCALCHGWDGAGHGINGQKFTPPPTNFHNPQTYLHGSDKDSLRRSIQYGIKEDSSIMPGFEDISPEELDQLIAYIQSLQKK